MSYRKCKHCGAVGDFFRDGTTCEPCARRRVGLTITIDEDGWVYVTRRSKITGEVESKEALGDLGVDVAIVDLRKNRKE